MYGVFAFAELKPEDSNNVFRPSFITPKIDKFQYDNQCCGWEGPDDYSIPLPNSCCGRKKASVRKCMDPYPNGCRLAYQDHLNILYVWRNICDFIRLGIIVTIFVLYGRFYVVRVKKSRRLKKIKKKLLIESISSKSDIISVSIDSKAVSHQSIRNTFLAFSEPDKTDASNLEGIENLIEEAPEKIEIHKSITVLPGNDEEEHRTNYIEAAEIEKSDHGSKDPKT